MKKFCSTCGNQLELSQRFCSQCGTINPYFVSSFSFLSDQSEELERLRLEKEKIDKELAEKEEQQAEFKKQEQLRREAEEAERLKIENQEKERLLKEQQERERIEQSLKEELLRVKEETELYKKETASLVNEVREGLQQIGEDNRRLKEEVANLSKSGRLEQSIASSPAQTRKSGDSNTKMRGFIVSLAIVLLALTSALAFFYFNARYENTTEEMPPVEKKEAQLKSLEPQPIAADTIASVDTMESVKETPASSHEPPASIPIPENKVPVRVENPKVEFTLSEARVKNDMIGKRISGCDIVIGSASEIESISNLSLVEKLGSGNLKYKFTASLVHGSDNFTATPYIYYTSDGAFIKIDGTNCE